MADVHVVGEVGCGGLGEGRVRVVEADAEEERREARDVGLVQIAAVPVKVGVDDVVSGEGGGLAERAAGPPSTTLSG